MTDDARRDRVKDAIQYASWSKNDWYVVPDKVLADLADAAIAAMNQPEPEPQLLEEIELAIGVFGENPQVATRAALRIVAKKCVDSYEWTSMGVTAFSDWSGIPESLVIELLHGE